MASDDEPDRLRADLPLPDAVMIDAKGYWWRVWSENPNVSMVPVNPDNSDIPYPVTYYRLVKMSPGVKLPSRAEDDMK